MALYEEKICEAIETIVNNAVSTAQYDRTIKGIIVECIDATIGKYKIKYQDTFFYAYTTNVNVKYSKNRMVYILVPGNDMSNEKTILGAVDKLGDDYVVMAEGEEAYETVGNNIIITNNEFQLCSYKKAQMIDIYDYTNEIINKISLDQNALKEYLKNSSNLVLSADFRTNLDYEQQMKGDYGIIYEIVFKNNADEKEVVREYVLNVAQMVGQPYKFFEKSKQSAIYNIDGENFQRIQKISIFNRDFPIEDISKDNDIFISNLDIHGANLIKQEEINGVFLSILTPRGTIFTGNDIKTTEKILQAQIKINGKPVQSDLNNLDYFWFKENSAINVDSEKYNPYGGRGWECLNTYNKLNNESSDSNSNIQWVGGDNVFIIQKQDCILAENKYKCVVNYNGSYYSKIITIKNLNYNYNLSIESDEGTQFYFDNGQPTLSCIIKNSGDKEIVDYSDYNFIWTLVNSQNNYTDITNLSKKLENGKSIIDKFDISLITDFSTIKCAVYNKNVYIGTASIILLNTYETEGQYSLIINNGEQIFQYDETGISPSAAAAKDKINILPLTFTIFDNLGKEINDDILKNCEIYWKVPKKDTMLDVPLEQKPNILKGDEDYFIYEKYLELNFNIDDSYNLYKQNNTIELQVKYKDLDLRAKTNFTFTKQGEIGTNGSKYTCKIIPRVQLGTIIPDFIIYKINANSNEKWNFTRIDNNYFPFEMQVFDGVNEIFKSYKKGGEITFLKWEILVDNYSKSNVAFKISNPTSDTASISFNKEINFNNIVNEGQLASILKCTVTIKGKEYYATLPICIYDNNNKIEIKNGIKYIEYSSDGVQPKYKDAQGDFPFEIEVDNYENKEYEWTSLNSKYLSIKGDKDKNICHIKPCDLYDGECVTNMIKCEIKEEEEDYGNLYIPIHFYFNVFGQAALNNWDGNSIDLGEDSGVILAPQVGAGQKDTNNKFTGVLIGTVKEGTNTSETGLFGYSSGRRSIFLDSKTGSASFGVTGEGQIQIIPGKEGEKGKATIQSGNYEENKSGMQIDFSTPRIKFGSGNFSVDENGYLVARGGGSIAGWAIGNDTLSKNGLVLDSTNTSIYSGNKITFYNTNNGFYLGPDGISLGSGNPFKVTDAGVLTATKGTIGGATITDSQMYMVSRKSSGSGDRGTGWGLYAHTSHANIALSIGSDQSNIGSAPFRVYHDGTLVASNANITGTITATAGKIGNWSISGGQIVGGNIRLEASGGIYGPNWGIQNNGQAYFSNVTITNSGYNVNRGNLIDFGANRFQIDNWGNMMAKSGSIGGWTIGNDLLSGGSISAGNISGSTITGGSINITTGGGGYLRAGLTTNHTEVSALNVDNTIVIKNHAIGFNNDAFDVQGNLCVNGEYRVNAGGTIYGGSTLNNQNFCIGFTTNSEGAITQSRWVGLTFIEGILVSVGDVQVINH